jgi:hypothetical protein
MSADAVRLSQVAMKNEANRAAIAFNFDATRCVDALTARHFMNQERDKTLDALNEMLDEVEAVQGHVKQQISQAQVECGIIRAMDDMRGVSHAAADRKLQDVWSAKGEAFHQVMEEHLHRYDELVVSQLSRNDNADVKGV